MKRSNYYGIFFIIICMVFFEGCYNSPADNNSAPVTAETIRVITNYVQKESFIKETRIFYKTNIIREFSVITITNTVVITNISPGPLSGKIESEEKRTAPEKITITNFITRTKYLTITNFLTVTNLQYETAAGKIDDQSLGEKKIITAELPAEVKPEAASSAVAAVLEETYVPAVHLDPYLFWINYRPSLIYSGPAGGGHAEILVKENLLHPMEICISKKQQRIFWSDMSLCTIESSSLDGSERNIIVSNLVSGTRGLYLDDTGGSLYWYDLAQAALCRLDFGKNTVSIQSRVQINLPVCITIDPAAKKIYWFGIGTAKIRSVAFDGTGLRDIVTAGIKNPSCLVLNRTDLFWTDSALGKISKISLETGEVKEIVTAGILHPSGLYFDDKSAKIYWTDFSSGKIQRANIDGSAPEVLFAPGGNPRGISLLLP